MLSFILSLIITTAIPGEPTEITGSAATATTGVRKEIKVIQPENAPNPFGTIVPDNQPISENNSQTQPSQNFNNENEDETLLTNRPQVINQTSEVYPKDMNPLDYKNQIENTLYQSGDRLINIQAIPIEDIKKATTPNLQPTITNFPSY